MDLQCFTCLFFQLNSQPRRHLLEIWATVKPLVSFDLFFTLTLSHFAPIFVGIAESQVTLKWFLGVLLLGLS